MYEKVVMGKRREIGELTIGYEWETLLLNKYGLPLKFEEIEHFISKIRNEVPSSRTGVDWVPRLDRALFEIRSGVLRNRVELEERTIKTVKATLELAKKEEFRFLPLGSYPPVGSAVGFHIHTGSWEKTEGLQEIANSLYPYVPCFAALSVNSPFWGMNPSHPPSEVKSYRLKYHAQLMSIPYYCAPDLSYLSWEPDITVKFLSHPTIELRIPDTPLSMEFVCEITVFVSSFIRESIKHLKPFSKQNFTEGIDNRIRAMRDGLQAIFLWEGKERKVTEILNEMIKTAYPTLKAIGYEELPLIKKMIRKRQTQADFLSYLFNNYNGDIYDFTTYLSSGLNLLKNPFQRYLNFIPKLPTKDLMDINEYLLSMIGKRTRYGILYRVLYQPTDVFEKRVWELKEKKLIDIQFDYEKGTLFSKHSD